MLHDAVGNDVVWVNYVFLTRLESQLVNLALARQSNETAASDTGIAPVSQAHGSVDLWPHTQRVARPC